MKRTLGPVALTAIGIGAIIGAGIFSLTGTAAAGQTFASRLETPVINFIQAWISGTGVVFGRAGAGPAIAASFIVAGIACAFAAFCYAELASMIPVSGSAPLLEREFSRSREPQRPAKHSRPDSRRRSSISFRLGCPERASYLDAQVRVRPLPRRLSWPASLARSLRFVMPSSHR